MEIFLARSFVPHFGSIGVHSFVRSSPIIDYRCPDFDPSCRKRKRRSWTQTIERAGRAASAMTAVKPEEDIRLAKATTSTTTSTHGHFNKLFPSCRRPRANQPTAMVKQKRTTKPIGHMRRDDEISAAGKRAPAERVRGAAADYMCSTKTGRPS